MPETLPLRDIHLPEPVGLWPPAPGWWLLAIIVFVIATLLLLRHRRFAIRRVAMNRLRDIEQRFKSDQDERAALTAVSTLLRRVCLSYRPRKDVAALTGDHWRRALALVTGPRGRFSEAVATQIIEGPYNPRSALEPAAVLREARRWVQALPPLGRSA